MRQLAFAVSLVMLLWTTTGYAQTTQSSGSEEGAIKQVIETAARAINKDDLATVLSQYADDAKIYTRVVGAQVSKERYAEIMTDVFKAGNLISVDVRDLRITMDDPGRATALGNVYVQTKTNRTSGRGQWKLERRADRWLIVETKPQ
jgi:uncharacterized protein (TIGR02246 family)